MLPRSGRQTGSGKLAGLGGVADAIGPRPLKNITDNGGTVSRSEYGRPCQG